MNQGLTPSIWVMISLGLSVYLGGNLIIATVLSLVLAGIGFPLVWGILGGSMPRSGGEYIYNSRILCHRHSRQRHRLSIRGVRHQGVRPCAEGGDGAGHHRRHHHHGRAYSYCITFIAGEVKRPDKSIILGNLFAIVVPAIFMILVAVGFYRLVDFNFLSATAWVDSNGLEGYTMPWSPHFVGLAAIVMHNKVLLFLMAFSFILFTLWWVALSYLAFPRIIFAWGMDRMGPKWFTSVNARFASPIKNYVLGFVLAEVLIALYVFWTKNPMQGLSVTALEIFSVFGVTAISAFVFPFSKRAKGIWESSPYRRWSVFGIPLVMIGAVVNMAYLVILAVFFFFQSADHSLEGFTAKTGIDCTMLTGELPPE